MKSQNSMFEPPEHRASGPQQHTADFREQRQEGNEEGRGYKEGYAMEGGKSTYEEPETQRMGGEKLFPQDQRKRGSVKLLLILLLILVLALAGNGLAVGRFNRGTSVLPSQTFTVKTQPTLVVNNGKGDVHIHTGNDGNVAVVAKQHADGVTLLDTSAMQVIYTQNENTIAVSSKVKSGSIVGDERVDLDITVPGASNLQVHTSSGAVEIEGVKGQMTLETGIGDISANNIDGQMKMSSSSGDIELGQAVLRGQTRLETRSGSITVHGGIDPQGDYQIVTEGGDISLSLPGSSSFHLNATHGSGDIDNEFEDSAVGSGPQANLTISTGGGDITLQKEA